MKAAKKVADAAAAAASASAAAIATAKSELLDVLYGTARGLEATQEQRARVEEKLGVLEACSHGM